MTLQNKIWASRIQRLPQEEINEVHLLGLNVLVGEKAGKVTKQVESDETGERYEVELEDGTSVEVGQHEVQIADADATEGEPSDDIQAEETEQIDEYGGGAMEDEEEETADYDTFFKAALKKFGVEDPGDFKSEEEKKKFFNYIDANFKGKKEKKESFSAEELAHFESVLKKNETTLDLDEAQYKAKDKKGYERLMNDVTHAMSKGLVAKGGAVGDYKKFTVDIKFKDEKSRKKFEKMNNLN